MSATVSIVSLGELDVEGRHGELGEPVGSTQIGDAGGTLLDRAVDDEREHPLVLHQACGDVQAIGHRRPDRVGLPVTQPDRFLDGRG